MKFLHELLPTLLAGVREVEYISNRGNSGDALIAAATEQILSKMGVEVVHDAPVVLVAGGGNLSPRYRCLRDAIDKIPRHKRVIILPHTVTAYWILLREFRNLTLLAREEVTLKVAEMEKVTAIPCHDAAFSFDFSSWSGAEDTDLYPFVNAFRYDGESNLPVKPEGNYDISKTYGGVWTLHSSILVARKFVSVINRYKEIRTDRLHVAIVAGMLGKKVSLQPNNYHKNRSVYMASLDGMPNVTFVRP